MRDVVIVEPVRTAVGGFGGSFKGVQAHELGAAVVEGLMARTGLAKDKVDDVIFAQCYPSMEAPALGRVVALDAGLPVTVPGTDSAITTVFEVPSATLSKVVASSKVSAPPR